MDALQILPQQLVFGLALGAVYGLIALGYTMVYGILMMINFAHGELFMIGAYVGWAVLAWLINAQLGGLHPVWVLPVLLLMAMSASAILGVTLERFAYRPLYTRGATRLGPLISAVGASIFLQNAVMLTQGARMKVYMTNLLNPPQCLDRAPASRENFLFTESINVLAMVIIGGMGSLLGVVLGAAVIVALPELFRELQAYRLLMFGFMLMVLMIFRPQGILAPRGSRR